MIAAGFEFVLFRGEVLSVFDPGMGAATYSAQYPVFPESERCGPRAVGGIADLFHPVAYGPLAAAEQRGRSARGAGVGGALGRPADDAALRARAGGCAQEGGWGVGSDWFEIKSWRGKHHADNGYMKGFLQ